MSTISTNAVQAYARAAGITGAPGAAASEGASASDFASLVQDALSNAMQGGKAAEMKSVEHIAGNGELVDVVTALTAAETTLETIVAVRDRVISAYQEISRMPI